MLVSPAALLTSWSVLELMFQWLATSVPPRWSAILAKSAALLAELPSIPAKLPAVVAELPAILAVGRW
jgi:hypothetical protein